MTFQIPELPSPPRYVFHIATPQHLLAKLYWEIEQLECCNTEFEPGTAEHLYASYKAFNTAVTAWHMVDWVWHSTTNKDFLAKDVEAQFPTEQSFRNALTKANRDLAICREIADGSKHKELRTSDSGVRVSLDWRGKYATVGSVRAGDPIATYNFQLKVIDDDIERDVVEFFKSVRTMWERYLSRWGFIEGHFISTDDET